MSAREELHLLIDHLPVDELEDVLDYVQWLASDHDTLTDEELEASRLGEEQIAQGQFVRLSDVRRRLAQ
ncbi:MAG TPA: hypothetical protein VMM78_09585 [Thermomicrobiales bacterium]|nr:hypothetical protein [Thermomicrobiales bacterium]